MSGIGVSFPRLCAGMVMMIWPVLFMGCPSPGSTTPVFPADYTSSYVEVRDCRRSPEHDLSFMKVWTSPDATGPYQSRVGMFPEGAVVLKEEYSDSSCTDRLGWTVMRREAGRWRWQEVLPDRTVLEDGPLAHCQACHEPCGLTRDGFEGTCAEP